MKKDVLLRTNIFIWFLEDSKEYNLNIDNDEAQSAKNTALFLQALASPWLQRLERILKHYIKMQI